MIDFSTITGVTLGSSEVTKIEDALGTILWQKIVYYNVSISAGANGTVTINGNPGPFSGSVASGTQLTIEGTGSTGYEFDEWSDGNTSNPRTITVTGDLTLTAAFKEIVMKNYFYVEDLSGSNNTLSIYSSNSDAPSIEVFTSTDGTNWNSMGTTSTTPIRATVPANDKLYLKATANTWTTTGNNADNCNHINCLGNYAIGGNIMSLLVGDNYQNATLDTNYTQQFKDVFSELSTGYRTLIDASQLVLPTNVTEECYYAMFESCTNLTAAPALPATTLANDCYRLMFITCTSLTAAPALPATTLANRCYYQMFDGCTALTSAPATLPATNTASYSCYRMFAGCSALTTAPTLQATTLAANCYRQMFDGCSSLNSVTTYANTKDNLNPPLSNWLQNVAATGDFYNLGQLTYTSGSASGIPSGWTEHHSLPVPCNVSISAGSNGSISVNGVPGNYSDTVMSDTQLTLVATPDSGYDFDTWSDGNTNATRTITVTGDLTLTASFAQAVLANYFYVEDVSGQPNTLSIVKSNDMAPIVQPYVSTDQQTWVSMGYTSGEPITYTIPANTKLYIKCSAESWGDYSTAYGNVITASGNHNVGGNIMSLLNADYFENTTLNTNYTRQFIRLFYNNTHLVDASDLELPNNVANRCYQYMFRGCSSLTTAPALPATTLANYCYYSMFSGCTALTTAPALSATTLAVGCYTSMFTGCTSLNRVEIYANDISATNCLNNWLNNVAATGDFYNLGSATYPSGTSGIPSGWTEHTSL